MLQNKAILILLVGLVIAPVPPAEATSTIGKNIVSGQIYAWQMTPDGSRIASGSTDQRIRIWEARGLSDSN